VILENKHVPEVEGVVFWGGHVERSRSTLGWTSSFLGLLYSATEPHPFAYLQAFVSWKGYLRQIYCLAHSYMPALEPLS
jgi:hypothetical protein